MIVSRNIEYAIDMDSPKKGLELKTFSAGNLVGFYPLPHHTNFPFKKAVEKIISKYKSVILYPISSTQVITVKGENATDKNNK